MAMNKRGIVFTSMAIIVTTVMLFAIKPPLYAPMKQRISAIQNRVSVANEHLNSLENVYLRRVLINTGYQALIAYTHYINDSRNEPTTLDELNQDLFEVMTNNSVDGSALNQSAYNITLLENRTLTDRLNNFTNLSREFLNIRAEVTVNSLEFFQSNYTGPWYVGVRMNSSVYLNGSIATWNVSEHNTTVKFSLAGVEDYYYTNHTRNLAGGGGPYRNYIEQANVTTWNLTTFSAHIGNRTYKHEPQAPNFLSRMVDSLEESTCCGIESIIYRDWNSYPTDNMSFIDYCYFGENCNGSDPDGYFSLYNVTGITNSSYPLKIEPYHFAEERYNLTYEEGILVPD